MPLNMNSLHVQFALKMQKYYQGSVVRCNRQLAVPTWLVFSYKSGFLTSFRRYWKMKLILEIPPASLDKIPFGYQNRLAERAILQIYEDGYISEEELTQICRKDFYQVFSQFTISLNRKTVTTELFQKRKIYFSAIQTGTGEWDDILHSIVSSRIDKEEPLPWGSK